MISSSSQDELTGQGQETRRMRAFLSNLAGAATLDCGAFWLESNEAMLRAAVDLDQEDDQGLWPWLISIPNLE
jgi:hypothetical protein